MGNLAGQVCTYFLGNLHNYTTESTLLESHYINLVEYHQTKKNL
jgi:hypothetical protein